MSVDRLSLFERRECGRCGAEVREGKRKHFCGEPYPLKATDDIRVVEYMPREQLRGAAEAFAQERQAVLDCVNLYGDETLHKALDSIGWPADYIGDPS